MTDAPLYNVALTGRILNGMSVGQVAEDFARLINRDSSFATALLDRGTLTLKSGLSLADANRYIAALAAIAIEAVAHPQVVLPVDAQLDAQFTLASGGTSAPTAAPAAVAAPARATASEKNDTSAGGWPLWVTLALQLILMRLVGVLPALVSLGVWWGLRSQFRKSGIGPWPAALIAFVVAAVSAIVVKLLFYTIMQDG